MQVPVKLYYTVNASLLNDVAEKNKQVNEQINLNIFIKDAGSFGSNLFTKISALKNNYIFSLSAALLNNEDLLKQLLPEFYLLTSLNIRAEEIIIPVIFDYPGEKDMINISVITSYFKNQGIENIKLPFFYSNKESIQNDQDCSLIIYSSGKENDINLIKAFKTLGNKTPLLAVINFEEEINDLNSLIENINQINSLKENFIDVPLENFRELFIEKKFFEEEKKRWKKRTELYRDFLSLSKTVQEREYYDVLNWYHNEYEILPLWYKRLGHIIKVIMGKRSFKSLFSDNVKKYKD
jgi:hypothetical protein